MTSKTNSGTSCFKAMASISMLAGLVFSATASASGYVVDEKSKCQAWAPSILDTQDYILRYQGECRNDRAEGKGKAEWLYRYAENKVAYTWEGRFRNGIFIGDQPVEGAVNGVPRSDRFMVNMGQVSGANLLFVSTSGQTSPMNLCAVEELAVETAGNTKAEDDDQIRLLLKKAGERYRSACPKATNSTFRIKAYRPPLALTNAGYLPQSFAELTFAPFKQGDEAYTAFSNQASEAVKNQKLQQAYQEKRAASRKHFIDFSRSHQVESWVTSANLDKNPFVWKGKTVALVVKLDRMLTASLALVQGVDGGGYWDHGSSLLLKGVKPDFFTDNEAVIVVRVDDRKLSTDLGDSAEYGVQATTLNFVDGQACERKQCAEWFSWDGANEAVNWNKPLRITP